MNPSFGAAQVSEWLSYDPETGELRWKKSPNGGAVAGALAGAAHNAGYRRVGIMGMDILAHRLAWLMAYGEWPSLAIDHIDGDRLNNRIANLRLATSGQNNQNKRISRLSTTGFKGVYFARRTGKFGARIKLNGKRIHLGYCATAEEAHARYVEAANIHFGPFARPA